MVQAKRGTLEIFITYADKKAMENNPSEFMPIQINDFAKGVKVPVDLFVRLTEDKFVMVAKAGTTSNVGELKMYQHKEVHYLWVKKKSYYKITHQMLSIAGIAINKNDLEAKTKTTVITHAARTVFRQMENIGMDFDVYGNAKQMSEVVVSLAENHRGLADLLGSLANFNDELLNHSVAVSVLSVMIGTQLGFEKKATLEKLGLAGMIHDVGMKALPIELVTKPLATMTSEEIRHYETHAFKGMQMLTSLGVVPDDVVSMVYEHHENSIGQGYPQRLRDVKMHPMAKIVALADAYASLILPNVNCPVAKNPREALMYMEHTLGIPYNKEAFRALKRVVDGEKKAA